MPSLVLMTTHSDLGHFDQRIPRAMRLGRHVGGSRLGVRQWFGHRRDISHGELADIVAASRRGGLGMMPRKHLRSRVAVTVRTLPISRHHVEALRTGALSQRATDAETSRGISVEVSQPLYEQRKASPGDLRRSPSLDLQRGSVPALSIIEAAVIR